MSDVKVRLADPTGGFFDPETGWGIVRDEEVALPSRIGKRTRAKLAAGGIVLVDLAAGETGPPSEAEGEAQVPSGILPPDGTLEARVDPVDGMDEAQAPSNEAHAGVAPTVEELMGHTAKELREMLRVRGVDARRWNKEKMAERLLSG